MLRICFSVVLFLSFNTDVCGQNFRPRGQGVGLSEITPQASTNPLRATPQSQSPVRPSVSNSASQQAGSISQDLMQIYGQTQSVRSEADASSVARLSARIVADSSRTKADRDYAASLLAWALNRRGEMRSEQAAALVQAGKLDSARKLDKEATEDFRAAVEYAPSKWRHRHNYAISLAMQGDYEKAIQQLDHAIELNPEYANAWFNRGELLFELGEFEAAEQDYSAAIELAQDAQYYNSRAHCRFLQQAYQPAISDYQQAAELSKANSDYYVDLGDAYQFLGRWEEAAQAYRDAVAVDNQCMRAYQNSAWLMATCPDERLRNPELALAAAKRALTLAQDRTAETVETLAAATASLGRFDEAGQLQEEAVRLASQSDSTTEDNIAEMRQRLTLYQEQRVYYQPQPAVSRTPVAHTRSASTMSTESSRTK